MPGGSGVLVSLAAVLALSVVAVLLLTKLRRSRRDADQGEEIARRRLLALTGADGLAWPANVAASEVLEAAMRAAGEDGHGVAREVEKTRPLPCALARDLVVVATELLDNALGYCDAEDVAISAKPARDGGVLVEVDDGGGGMDRDQLREANRALKTATPPTLEDGFGLFLVGRLATRHGMKVVLSQREEGVRATVHVPVAALSAAASRDAGRRPAQGQG
ncbi:MAG: ATP-binding protein, partial [Actinomycetes bacterium]